MAKVIESSFGNCALDTGIGLLAGLKFRVRVAWRAYKYKQADIAKVIEIDSETYRSAGGAAIGSIIGGVLTGGVGLLAGAAIGGRRRSTASYIVWFSDGNHIAFTEKRRDVIRVLDDLAKKALVSQIVAADAPLPQK